MFNPTYKLNHKILNMLTAIAEAKAIIERAKLLPKQEIRLRRQALIRMSHSSTHIEGNILNINEVGALYARQKIDAPTRDIYEVQNYLKALQYIGKVIEDKLPITEKVILKIHKLVTDKTLPNNQSGHYRKGPVYVVRRKFGVVEKTVYTAPDAKVVPELMKNLVSWIHQSQGETINPVIVAGLVHQEIAAIHPFSDGNGRTARALATLLLYERGYDFRRLFALEDYYNEDRAKYYEAINIGKNYQERQTDLTHWLEYFVKGFKQEIDNVKTKITSLAIKKLNNNLQAPVYLDKDQMKILDFLDQVGKITMKDVVDILECPKRTAQSYLQRLKKLGMINQVGKGPASGYTIKE